MGRERPAAQDPAPLGDASPPGGGVWQCGGDEPLLRYQPSGVVQAAIVCGEMGEKGLRDRSSRPHRSPGATSSEVAAEIVHLHQHYHLGPLKIAMYLKRCCDIERSSSGVWRVLDRLGMGRLLANQRY